MLNGKDTIIRIVGLTNKTLDKNELKLKLIFQIMQEKLI